MVRVTKNQHERIKNAALAKGFRSISDYVRSLTLGNDLVFEQRFNDLYNKLMSSNVSESFGENKEKPLKSFF